MSEAPKHQALGLEPTDPTMASSSYSDLTPYSFPYPTLKQQELLAARPPPLSPEQYTTIEKGSCAPQAVLRWHQANMANKSTRTSMADSQNVTANENYEKDLSTPQDQSCQLPLENHSSFSAPSQQSSFERLLKEINSESPDSASSDQNTMVR